METSATRGIRAALAPLDIPAIAASLTMVIPTRPPNYLSKPRRPQPFSLGDGLSPRLTRAGNTNSRSARESVSSVASAPVQEAMGLKRGHRFPARFIGEALHLVSFDRGRTDDPAISRNGLRETLRGGVILFEQSMLFLAGHGPISMGQP